MIDEKLMRRISDALSSPKGLDGDEGLRSILAENPQARAYADDVARLDGLLRGWPIPALSSEAGTAMEARIDGGLAGAGKLFGDMTQPPKFDDAYAHAPPESEYSVDNLDSLSVTVGQGGGPEKERPSLPPLPQPTGERAAIPDVKPMQFNSGFTIPSSIEPEAVAPESARPPAAAKGKWYPMAIAAVVLLGAGLAGVFAMRRSPSEEPGAVAATGAPTIRSAPAAERTAEEPGRGIEGDAPDDATGHPDELSIRTALGKGGSDGETAPEAAPTAGGTSDGAAARTRAAKSRGPKRSPSASAAAKSQASARTAPTKATATLSDVPSKEAVLAAMKGVQPRVMACKTGRHGTMMLKITVSGTTGKVQSAAATGSFAGSPEGDCAVRAVRSANFPKFKKPSLTISYPFQF
jgi:hypothetical protein